MKVLHLEYTQYPAEAVDNLKSNFLLETFECSNQQALYEKLSSIHYDAIFTKLGLMIDKKAMDLQPALKFIITPTTGLNHIDIEEARMRGIQLVSLKGESAFLADIKSTAEHTWGLLLSLIRHIPEAHRSVVQGNWERNPFLSDELDGKTLGIIGYGRLGKIVARYGLAFGMRVLVHDHQYSKNDLTAEVEVSALEPLLAQADVVILMISWSTENEDFMNEKLFDNMKTGAYFINTSRGELVDEQSLLHALQAGKLKGAALDVLWHDSAWDGKAEGSKVLLEYARDHSNLIITPHMGGYGKDSIAKTRKFVTNKFISLAKSNS